MRSKPQPLTRQNIVSELALAVPGLADSLLTAIDDDPSGLGQLHFTLVPVLSDALLHILEQSHGQDDLSRPYVVFLERMATSEDQYVRDLAGTGIIETLLGSGTDRAVASASNLLGPISLAWLREINARQFGRLIGPS